MSKVEKKMQNNKISVEHRETLSISSKKFEKNAFFSKFFPAGKVRLVRPTSQVTSLWQEKPRGVFFCKIQVNAQKNFFGFFQEGKIISV